MRLMDATLAAGVKITNVAQWCRDNNVDRRTFYRHRRRIAAEGSWQPRSRRPQRSPGQTPVKVAEEIVRLRAELAPDNGADAIVAALAVIAAGQDWAGAGLAVPHRSTVNKILKRALRREKFLVDRIADPVYWRPRGAADFRRFTDHDLDALRERFQAAGQADRLEQ